MIRIDHWFGPRWLGFCGKLYGIAGVRTRRGTARLTVPPFHPHRVQFAREFHLGEGGAFVDRGPDSSLHDWRNSHDNINRSMRRGVYGWSSGDTASTGRGAVMVYVVTPHWSTAWYAGFERRTEWCLTTTKWISPQRVLQGLRQDEESETESARNAVKSGAVFP